MPPLVAHFGAVTLAVILIYVAGFVAESAGGVSVLRTSIAARRFLKSPRSGFEWIDNGDGTARLEMPGPHDMTPSETLVLGALAVKPWALALLGVGIVCGFAGNLLSLAL